ncbi:hypothetical protein POTOM_061968 [Populus tomentosa]|uniref:Uncharacterized protein n=1 Tax=Populus tomentosa TaxID=118781 RepID=A0A8X8BY24_POPTO|nr:hypothetical protein POTOM_061968 [Populus tomentosa]
MECIHGFPGQNSVSPAFCGFDDLYNERSACSRFSLSSITEQWYYKKALASCTNFSSSYDYGCSSCIEAISDFRDYQLRISNVSANDKKAKIVCGVAVLISVVAENLKNSAWIDDFYRCLPASDAFNAFNEGYMQIKCKYNYSVFSLKEFIHFLEFYMSIAGYTGSCTNLCTDRVKKPVSGVRILQDKFPTSLLDSVWNLCNWQSKVSKVGFRPLVMVHFPTKSATLKFLTRMAGSGTEFPNIRLLRYVMEQHHAPISLNISYPFLLYLVFLRKPPRLFGVNKSFCQSLEQAQLSLPILSKGRGFGFLQLPLLSVLMNLLKSLRAAISSSSTMLSGRTALLVYTCIVSASEVLDMTGSCTNLCVDRVKKPVSGVRILQDKFPDKLVGFCMELMQLTVKGSGTEFPNIRLLSEHSAYTYSFCSICDHLKMGLQCTLPILACQ